MKTTAAKAGEQVICEECGVDLTDENGHEHISCGNCEDTLFADDKIICTDDELPRSKDNPISAQQAFHYCSEECYFEHKGEREAEYAYMAKKGTSNEKPL